MNFWEIFQNLRNFGENFNFSRFFHHVQNPRSFTRPSKKSGNFHLIESGACGKVPSVLETSEIERGDHQLSPKCRNIAQLPIARKLQEFEVRRFGSKSGPKTGPGKWARLEQKRCFWSLVSTATRSFKCDRCFSDSQSVPVSKVVKLEVPSPLLSRSYNITTCSYYS